MTSFNHWHHNLRRMSRLDLNVSIVTNAAMKTQLAKFRNRTSSQYECCTCVENLSFFLAGAASNYFEQKEIDIISPLGVKQCQVIDETVILVPILRAGLSMLSGFQRVIQNYEVGFVWAHRDITGKSHIENAKFPSNIKGATVIILDTMLATGGTVNACVDLLNGESVRRIWVASIISTQFGIECLSPQIERLFTVDTSDGLDEQLYVFPGVGDSGDRLFGKNKK